MKKQLAFILFLFAFSFSYGQKTSLREISTIKSKKGLVEWYDRYIWSNNDTAYIALPNERFMISANILLSGIHNRVLTNIPKEDVYFDYKINSGVCSKWSIGVAYRDLSISYSRNISGSYGRDFSIGSYGNVIGGEIQWQSYEKIPTKLHIINEKLNIDEIYESDGDDGVDRVKGDKFLVNLYYVVNHKKFSYNAAFSQTFIQKKSCGSIIVGATYIYNHIVADNVILDFVYEADKPTYTTHDIAIGAGYAYNFVFSNRHFMAHISAMPLLKYTIKAKIERNEPLGEEYEDASFVDILNDEIDEFNNKHINLKPSYIGRVAFLYTAGRYVAGVQGVYNYFWSGDDKGLALSTNTWQARAYFGVRF